MELKGGASVAKEEKKDNNNLKKKKEKESLMEGKGCERLLPPTTNRLRSSHKSLQFDA